MPITESIKGWPVSKYLKELEQSQWYSPAELREMQNEKLRGMVRHAYDTVEYYREVFDSLKLTPDDIKSIEDLPKLPILTKDQIRANFPDKMRSRDFDPAKLIIGKSSGSTGEPLKYYLTPREKGFKWACLYRWWRWTGYDFGRKYVNFTVIAQVAFRGIPLAEWLEKTISRALILQAKDMNAENVGDLVRQIQQFKPILIKGHPSTCYYMARYMADHDIKFEGVKAAICNGETLVPHVRDLIAEQYQCGVWDMYGSEGIETAAQCSPNSHHHVTAEAVVTEIVDREGNPVPSGTEGRLIVTALDKWAMPFIRYDTQDAATMSDEVCSCGRGLPLLSSVKGRIVDMGLSPSGKLLSVYAFTPLFAKQPGVDAWQVVQEAPALLSVKIKPAGSFDNATLAAVEREIKDYVGDDVEVTISLVDEIPFTPSGKRRFFISKCPYGVQ